MCPQMKYEQEVKLKISKNHAIENKYIELPQYIETRFVFF